MAGRGSSCFGRGALRYEGGGGGVGDDGGAPCWALLPPGLGRLGPNVIEEVLGGSGSRCRCGAEFALGFGLGCRLRSWRADGFLVAVWRRSWVSAGSRVWASSGRGPWRRRGCSRWGRVWGPVWEVSPAAWWVECWMRMWWWWWMRWSWWWRLWSRRRRKGLWETAEGPGLRGRA